jgi:hypothetical protein
MKKSIIYILLTIGCFLKANAQYTIEYVYDNSGNRTSRTIITLPAHSSTPNDTIPPAIGEIGERKVELFPNPTKGRLTVRISGGKEDETCLFTLFNTSGVQIYQDKQNGQGEHPIEMMQYNSGIYILVINVGKDRLSYKIIKE